MQAIRQVALTLVLFALGGCWAQVAMADDAAELFDPAKMYVIKLTLPPEKETVLGKTKTQPVTHPFDYQSGGTFSIAKTDGTPDGVGPFTDPVPVKVRLKGNWSLRYLDEKAAFKVKFEDPDPQFNLRVLTLNNMVTDPSMIHETLAYTAYRGVDVPASRTGYAYVYLNGRDYGIHLNIETVDEIALAKLFGSFDEGTQHLYEGEDGDEVLPGTAEEFEVDEGVEENLDDLEELIEAVNSSGSQSWAERVTAAADLEEMTRMWATEKYIGQWDGYAGAEESWMPNNYYLYSDPSGVFQMLPWGNDETWLAQHHLAFDGHAGLMFDLCLEDPTCFAVYREAVAAVRKDILGMGLDTLAIDTAALLAPWQEMEEQESTREEWGREEFEDGVEETRDFIATRPAEAAEWLRLNETPTPGTAPTGATSASTEAAKSGGPGGSRLRVGRTSMAGGVLRTRMQLRTGGLVTQRATVSTGRGALVICRDRARVGQARSLTLRCQLPASILERLRQKPLGITVATRFFPAGGSPENIARWITLPRL